MNVFIWVFFYIDAILMISFFSESWRNKDIDLAVLLVFYHVELYHALYYILNCQDIISWYILG